MGENSESGANPERYRRCMRRIRACAACGMMKIRHWGTGKAKHGGGAKLPGRESEDLLGTIQSSPRVYWVNGFMNVQEYGCGDLPQPFFTGLLRRKRNIDLWLLRHLSRQTTVRIKPSDIQPSPNAIRKRIDRLFSDRYPGTDVASALSRRDKHHRHPPPARQR